MIKRHTPEFIPPNLRPDGQELSPKQQARGQQLEEQASKDESQVELGDLNLVELENRWGKKLNLISQLTYEGLKESKSVNLANDFELLTPKNYPITRDKHLGITTQDKTSSAQTPGQIPDQDIFEYSRLDLEQLQAQEQEFIIFKEEVLGSFERKKETLIKRRETQAKEQDQLVEGTELEKIQILRILYLQKINEQIARNRMLQATVTGDMKKFQRYSDFIYGRPQPEHYQHALEQRTRAIKNYLEQVPQIAETMPEVSVELERSCQQALELLSELGVNIDNVQPQAKEFKPQTERSIPMDEVAKLLQPGIDNINARLREQLQDPDFGGLVLVQESNSGNWAVTYQDQSGTLAGANLKGPAKGGSTIGSLARTIAHEVDTHFARRIGGFLSGYYILESADRYLATEEGLATFAEQKLDGILDAPQAERNIAGEAGMLAISMSLDQNLNFKELYEKLKILIRPWAIATEAAKSGQSEEEILTQAEVKDRRFAYYRAYRSKRGTDGAEGQAFTRDLAYFSGNQHVLDLIDTKEGQETLVKLKIGKIGPQHLRFLAVLGLQEPEMGDKIFADDLYDLAKQQEIKI